MIYLIKLSIYTVWYKLMTNTFRYYILFNYNTNFFIIVNYKNYNMVFLISAI